MQIKRLGRRQKIRVCCFTVEHSERHKTARLTSNITSAKWILLSGWSNSTTPCLYSEGLQSVSLVGHSLSRPRIFIVSFWVFPRSIGQYEISQWPVTSKSFTVHTHQTSYHLKAYNLVHCCSGCRNVNQFEMQPYLETLVTMCNTFC